jgi:hypothetical protein
MMHVGLFGALKRTLFFVYFIFVVYLYFSCICQIFVHIEYGIIFLLLFTSFFSVGAKYGSMNENYAVKFEVAS